MPIIMPSTMKGPLINQFVAPTYFIIFISFDLANTVSLIVFDTTTTDTTIKKPITRKAPICRKFVTFVSFSTVSLKYWTSSTPSKVRAYVETPPALSMVSTLTRIDAGRGFLPNESSKYPLSPHLSFMISRASSWLLYAVSETPS